MGNSFAQTFALRTAVQRLGRLPVRLARAGERLFIVERRETTQLSQ